MYKIIYYIEYNKDYTCLYYEKNKKVILEEYCKVLNKMCLREIVTLKGRREAFSKLWGSKYNVPLYIDKKHLFLKVDSNILINYYFIRKIDNNGDIYLLNDMVIKSNRRYRSIYTNYQKLKEIVKKKKLYIQFD